MPKKIIEWPKNKTRKERKRDLVENIFVYIFAVLVVILGFVVMMEAIAARKEAEEAGEVLRASEAVEAECQRLLKSLKPPVTMVEVPDFPVFVEVVAVPYYNEAIPLPAEEQAALYASCQEFNVPFALALGVMEQETRFQMLTGDGGASVGYFQIQPRWWAWLMDDIGVTDLSDPAQNIRTGCAVLGYLLDLSEGDVRAALGRYNLRAEYPAEVLARVEIWEGNLEVDE